MHCKRSFPDQALDGDFRPSDLPAWLVFLQYRYTPRCTNVSDSPNISSLAFMLVSVLNNKNQEIMLVSVLNTKNQEINK